MSEFPFDIVLLALVAVFIALRLRGALGKNFDGDGGSNAADLRKALRQQRDDRVIQMPGTKPVVEEKDELAELKDEEVLERISNSNVSAQLLAIRRADARFSVSDFLDGARGAFDWVMEAFRRGDRAKLEYLMSKDVYEAFAKELGRIEKEKETTGRKPETTLVSILSADVTQAELKKDTAVITVKFVSEQVHLVRDKNGKVLEGDPSAIERVEDEWTFEREVSSRTPDWKITAT